MGYPEGGKAPKKGIKRFIMPSNSWYQTKKTL